MLDVQGVEPETVSCVKTSLRMLVGQAAEFEPTEVKGLQQQRGLAEEHLWRYLMLWRRKPDGSEVRITQIVHKLTVMLELDVLRQSVA